METTNAPAPAAKTRRTYALAGVFCLCWEGSLYAAPSWTIAVHGSVKVSPGPTADTVLVEDFDTVTEWYRATREEIKARGAEEKKGMREWAELQAAE
jgi:hypothetical protein